MNGHLDEDCVMGIHGVGNLSVLRSCIYRDGCRKHLLVKVDWISFGCGLMSLCLTPLVPGCLPDPLSSDAPDFSWRRNAWHFIGGL